MSLRESEARRTTVKLPIEFEEEEDGRWIAEIPLLPGVMAYGDTKADAHMHVLELALRVLLEKIKRGETVPAEPAELDLPLQAV